MGILTFVGVYQTKSDPIPRPYVRAPVPGHRFSLYFFLIFAIFSSFLPFWLHIDRSKGSTPIIWVSLPLWECTEPSLTPYQGHTSAHWYLDYDFFAKRNFSFFALFSPFFNSTQFEFGCYKREFKHCTPPIMVWLALSTPKVSIMILK